MARYTGPKTKIARKFGEPIYGPDKAYEKRVRDNKNYPSGQHRAAKKRQKDSYPINQLNSTAALWTATIVRNRSNVYDLGYFDTCVMNGPDGGLAASARTLYKCLYLVQTCVNGNLCTIFSSYLSCVRSVLLGSSEAHLSG